MNLKMLSWFLFFFLFLQIVLRSACDTTFTLADAAGSELSENNGGTESEGSNARIEIDKETRERISEEVKMVHTKVRKGSPASSRNLRRPRHSGAASTYPASSSLVIGVVLQVSIGLLQVFSSFF
ncbi:uncharacterized protein LOC122085201 [Macadamia integrifolia]|uniref:uncharacterized protein LOC122085201 n=1 Tax=Macadamia integrifolia TaxID=60698 RepID=UPI001C4ECA66|nr:uncharacterized protein LOC122085201 [Macadamia integrifolia]